MRWSLNTFAACLPIGTISSRSLITLLSASAVALCSSHASAADLAISWDSDLAFDYDRDNYQRSLKEIAERSYDQASAAMGLSAPRRLEVNVYSRAHYEKEFGAGAAATRGAHYLRGRIHVNGGSRLSDALSGELVHEMTHAVLDYRGTGSQLPTWFNEGLAERMRWTRQGLNDLAPNQAAELKQSRQRGTLTPLPSRGRLTPFGYLNAYAAVLFLEKKFGRDKVLALAHQVIGGTPFERALDAQLRLSLTQLELGFADWVDHLP